MTKTYRQAQTLEDRVQASEDAANGKKNWTDTSSTTPLIRKIHMGGILNCTSGSATAATVPADADAPDIAIGESTDVRMGGAGQVTITAGSGATLRKAAATAKILAQYGMVRVTKTAANTWTVNGELAAS